MGVFLCKMSLECCVFYPEDYLWRGLVTNGVTVYMTLIFSNVCVYLPAQFKSFSERIASIHVNVTHQVGASSCDPDVSL